MKKIKVRIIEPIAGLADPRSTSELDEKYRRHVEAINKGRQVPFSRGYVDDLIGRFKAHDRYGEKPIGFPRDWVFKAGDEVYINPELAEKWQESGICLILSSVEEPTVTGKKAA